MTISAVRLTEQRTNYAVPMAAAGAALGALGRYVVPTKEEIKNVVNKENVDAFVSSGAMATRAGNRSMVKSIGIGAAILGGISLIASKIKEAQSNKEATQNVKDYSKYGVLIDASPDAYAVYCYGDE